MILFSGSARATPAMLEYTANAVQRAAENGWLIAVGDNPSGIDLKVAEICAHNSYAFTVCSVAGEKARSMLHLMEGIRPPSKHRFEAYHGRDEGMVDLLADKVMVIWDGASKGSWERAVEQGGLPAAAPLPNPTI